MKPSGHGEPDLVGDMLPTPVPNWRENEGGGMPSSIAPPTDIDTLASDEEATGVAMLTATDSDRISTTNGGLVDATYTIANALVVAGRNGGAPPRFPPLLPPRGEWP